MTAYRVVEPSGSNGSIQFAVDGDFSSSTGLVFITGSDSLGVGTPEPDARLHVSGGTILDAGASGLHQITGSAVFVTGLSGSLTQLASGIPYLVAGDNVTIATGSNGQITISATGVSSSAPNRIGRMSWMETPAGVTDGLNMMFTLQHEPVPKESLMLYVNGVLQREGVANDYLLAGNSIMTVTAPSSDSQIVASYAYETDIALGSNIAWMEVPVGAVDGANQSFMLSKAPYPGTALMFYYNGVLQLQGIGADYVLVGSKNIVTNFIPEVGSSLSAMYPY